MYFQVLWVWDWINLPRFCLFRCFHPRSGEAQRNIEKWSPPFMDFPASCYLSLSISVHHQFNTIFCVTVTIGNKDSTSKKVLFVQRILANITSKCILFVYFDVVRLGLFNSSWHTRLSLAIDELGYYTLGERVVKLRVKAFVNSGSDTAHRKFP